MSERSIVGTLLRPANVLGLTGLAQNILSRGPLNSPRLGEQRALEHVSTKLGVIMGELEVDKLPKLQAAFLARTLMREAVEITQIVEPSAGDCLHRAGQIMKANGLAESQVEELLGSEIVRDVMVHTAGTDLPPAAP